MICNIDSIAKHTSPDGKFAPSWQGAKGYLTEHQRFIREHSGMLSSLMLAQTYAPENSHAVGNLNSLHAYFDHGAASIREKLVGKPKVAPELMARMSFVTILACIMFKDWLFPRGLASDQAIQEAINDFVIAGFSANERHA